MVNCENIKCRYLYPLSRFISKPKHKILTTIHTLIRVLLDAVQLIILLLCKSASPDVLIVQTPPAIPTLLICRVVTWLRRTKYIIDVHNVAYTLMGKSNYLTSIAKWYEENYSMSCDEALCVSKTMKEHLVRNSNGPSSVLIRRQTSNLP